MLQNAPLGALCNTVDLHYAIIGLENQFWSYESGHFSTGLTVNTHRLISLTQSHVFPTFSRLKIIILFLNRVKIVL